MCVQVYSCVLRFVLQQVFSGVLKISNCTSAGVDILCPSGLTNEVVLVEPGALLRHHHRLGGSLSPRVDHLRDRICVWEQETGSLV